jgi:HD superfamily phosphohydrolase
MNSFKSKIINDPVYGFITIPSLIIFNLVQHPYFQRLRNIKQLGLSNLVYPGANHTRFHHALGAMHLVGEAIAVLRQKGVAISTQEATGVTIAVLLHDIGHGPFSHTLENIFLPNLSHEEISLAIMKKLNLEFEGQLNIAIEIFTNQYKRKFLNQLVSSQLDVDRLDYLTRDSFFTGVVEGVISYDRIINMLMVVNDELVVEEKGLYSIEKFLTSRRLMYWQVYFHKTVLIAEQNLIKIVTRAKELYTNSLLQFCTPNLAAFFNANFESYTMEEQLAKFALLDDSEILANVKYWQFENDASIKLLSQMLTSRQLMRIEMQNEPFEESRIELSLQQIMQTYLLTKEAASYVQCNGIISNYAYKIDKGQITILLNNGDLIDVLKLLTHLNIPVFTEPTIKHYLSFVK